MDTFKVMAEKQFKLIGESMRKIWLRFSDPWCHPWVVSPGMSRIKNNSKLMPKCWPIQIFHIKSIVSSTLCIALGNAEKTMQKRFYFLLGYLHMYAYCCLQRKNSSDKVATIVGVANRRWIFWLLL
jgi:hypothetical protein